VASIGHVEWVEFAAVDRVPPPGGIAHARHLIEVPAGGGAVAAVQLRKLAGAATFLTALSRDALGERSRSELGAMGVHVDAAPRERPQRRALTLIDADGERTITTIGDKLVPQGVDPLAWEALERVDAAFFVSGDADAVRRARAARVLTATSRVLDAIEASDVELDALIGSARDPLERYRPGDLDPAPKLVVRTDGRRGGAYETAEGESGSWAAAPLPGPLVDTYGAGDSFAAGLTYGLGAGLGVPEAIELAARCGAACATGRGPYAAQLTLDPRTAPAPRGTA
jgi:ribokinase